MIMFRYAIIPVVSHLLKSIMQGEYTVQCNCQGLWALAQGSLQRCCKVHRRVPKGVRQGENRTSVDADGVSGWLVTGTSMVMAVEIVGAEEVVVLLCSELCCDKYLLIMYQQTTMSGKRRHEQRINMIVNVRSQLLLMSEVCRISI